MLQGHIHADRGFLAADQNVALVLGPGDAVGNAGCHDADAAGFVQPAGGVLGSELAAAGLLDDEQAALPAQKSRLQIRAAVLQVLAVLQLHRGIAPDAAAGAHTGQPHVGIADAAGGVDQLREGDVDAGLFQLIQAGGEALVLPVRIVALALVPARVGEVGIQAVNRDVRVLADLTDHLRGLLGVDAESAAAGFHLHEDAHGLARSPGGVGNGLGLEIVHHSGGQIVLYVELCDLLHQIAGEDHDPALDAGLADVDRFVDVAHGEDGAAGFLQRFAGHDDAVAVTVRLDGGHDDDLLAGHLLDLAEVVLDSSQVDLEPAGPVEFGVHFNRSPFQYNRG